MEKPRFRFSIVSCALYVIALLAFAYTIAAFIYSVDYIKQMVDANQLVVSESFFDIINFIIQSCGGQFMCGVGLFAAGWLIQLLTPETTARPGLSGEAQAPPLPKDKKSGSDKDNSEDGELSKYVED